MRAAVTVAAACRAAQAGLSRCNRDARCCAHLCKGGRRQERRAGWRKPATGGRPCNHAAIMESLYTDGARGERAFRWQSPKFKARAAAPCVQTSGSSVYLVKADNSAIKLSQPQLGGLEAHHRTSTTGGTAERTWHAASCGCKFVLSGT